jgi:hypothetical protein
VRSLLQVVGAVARNRALAAVMVAYGVFSATQNAVWIAMLVYAYDRGGAGTAGAVAVAQLLPAALLAPVAAAVADRRSPVGVLVGGYLIQVAGMLTTALAIAVEAPLAAYAGAVVASAAVATTRPAQTPWSRGWSTTPRSSRPSTPSRAGSRALAWSPPAPPPESCSPWPGRGWYSR